MGVVVKTQTPGDGQTYPKQGQTVVVHYTGTLENGSKFDSSRDRGVPFKFRLGKGEVIRGWDEGVAQMCVGERATLTCSPDYAYGSRGHPGLYPFNANKVLNEPFALVTGKILPHSISAGPDASGFWGTTLSLLAGAVHKCKGLKKRIPPNSVLIFDVELLRVEP